MRLGTAAAKSASRGVRLLTSKAVRSAALSCYCTLANACHPSRIANSTISRPKLANSASLNSNLEMFLASPRTAKTGLTISASAAATGTISTNQSVGPALFSTARSTSLPNARSVTTGTLSRVPPASSLRPLAAPTLPMQAAGRVPRDTHSPTEFASPPRLRRLLSPQALREVPLPQQIARSLH